MKKRLVLLPIIMLSTVAVSGCSCSSNDASVTAITYGTYLGKEMTELDFDGLKNKFVGDQKGENFLLVGAFDKNSGCSCWSGFKSVVESFINNNNYLVYSFDKVVVFNSYNEKEAANWGLQLPGKGSSSLYIVNDGKVVKQFDYSANDKFFSDSKTFANEIVKYISAPQMYYVAPESLDEHLLTNKEDAIVHYMWNDCPDCQYCGPNFLVPYSKNNKLEKKMYVVDTASVRDQSPEGKFGEPYINFNKKWKLSEASGSVYGYSRGFVPTTQYWSRGELVDASVYFNDTIEKQADGSYKVTESFYTEARKQYLHYLDGVENPVLVDLSIPSSDVSVFEYEGVEYASWDKPKAARYHNALLEAFMNKYAK